MKKFNFSLKVLLDVRIREEKSVKGELNLAQARLVQLEKQLSELEKQLQEEQLRLKENSKNGITVNEFQAFYNYIDNLKQGIKNQISLIEPARIKCSSLLEKLIGVKRDIKMLETLKEQKYKEYLKEVEIEELKVMDDFINSRQTKN